MKTHQFCLYCKILQGLVSHYVLRVRDLVGLAPLLGDECYKTALSLGHQSDTSEEDNVPAGSLLPSKPHAVPLGCCCKAEQLLAFNAYAAPFQGKGQEGVWVSDVSGRQCSGRNPPFLPQKMPIRRSTDVHSWS